jgi:rifampicin phosphotransferase
MYASRSTSSYYCLLDGPNADHQLVGGKGASLCRLAALAAPVPPAFALTIYAYEAHARRLGLPTCASETADSDLPAIRSRILEAELPPDVSESLARGLDAIDHHHGNGHTLAVRSSATVEDSPQFSFAGLHDSVLDVSHPPPLERAVRRCWASSWSDRAISYRRMGDAALDTVTMAVVVQRLVRSDVSFVVFTADPVAMHETRIVISATYGLGEAIVSGLVTPDHIVLDDRGEIERYVIGAKEYMIVPAANPGDELREVPVPRLLSREPCLTHEQARQIGQVARALDAALGFRLDIEGAIAGGEVYLFQVRPITTLNGHTAVQRKHSDLVLSPS